MINHETCPKSNPDIIIRQEVDEWGLLFNLETSRTLGLNPTGVFIWNMLDGNTSVKTIIEEAKKRFSSVPDTLDEQIINCLKILENKKLIFCS